MGKKKLNKKKFTGKKKFSQPETREALIRDLNLDSESNVSVTGIVNRIVQTGGPTIFVVNDGTVKARQVETGIQSETHIEVLSGLELDDEVVVGNYRAISQLLQNNSKVAVEEKNEETFAANANR